VVPVVEVATVVVRDATGRLLITRRPAHGLLARMWCFPGVEMTATDDAATLALDLARRITARTGSRQPFIPASATPRALATIEHTFSHRRERYQCFIVDAEDTGVADDDVTWIGEAHTSYALPRAQQRIRSMALAAGHPGSRNERATPSG
jgi:adenine-specific DNA glycosylase